MNKLQMLDSIANAKSVHLEQMSKIESVMQGKKIDNPTPIGKMDCECGVWFYDNTNMMKEILGAQLFQRLDECHTKWHIDYVNIYNIFFKEVKKGLFSKITASDKLDEMLIDKAKLYYSELKETTAELLKIADSATRRVNAIKDSKFS